MVGTASKFVCITRTRRFGNTINAMMLASYYSKNADFKSLFDKLKIPNEELQKEFAKALLKGAEMGNF